MASYNYAESLDSHNCIIPPKDFNPFKIENIFTCSKSMKRIIDLALRIAGSNAPVLILGPSGVGKEELASLIHKNSKRAQNSFVKLNCSAIPDNLIESEFFGYEAGSFTGASRSGKKGLIELAEKGTLFLDELGEMPPNLQTKLLRVLQNGKFLKIGAYKESSSDTRIIAATNKDLQAMIKSGTFREDLYFRLNVIPIHIPRLNERREDIPLLSMYFLDYFNKQYNVNKKIRLEVMNQLLCHNWPGNIRELKNTIERLVLISLDDVITMDDLSYSYFAENKYNSIESSISDIQYIPNMTLREMVNEFETNIITQAVKKYGSIRKAAKVLDVTPSTLSRKLNRGMS
ncbi:sigma-54 interaction domain-containing protein [Lutispora saccharofermentans]|uniref:HTH-type transcriptional regulatory protein TyrR n=1 Tax=Lutispora saccharofermentans TaxID=3024236 RepID=A0ABT1NE24_9FIRM|nr:sigma 54-interacting transcriptional regulator [Lutispora saccharofermentans]